MKMQWLSNKALFKILETGNKADQKRAASELRKRGVFN